MQVEKLYTLTVNDQELNTLITALGDSLDYTDENEQVSDLYFTLIESE